MPPPQQLNLLNTPSLKVVDILRHWCYTEQENLPTQLRVKS